MRKGEVLDAEVVEGEDILDPTDLRSLFFRKCELDKVGVQEVESDLKTLMKEAHDSRADLDNLLAHWYDLAEGIAPPKNFPWPNSSNLHIPVTETKLNELHSASRQTILRGDQVYTIQSIGDPLEPQQLAKLERYLNYKVTTHLSLTGKFSDLVWVAARDGLALAHVYYHEEVKTVPRIESYAGLQAFMAAYPTVGSSGLSKAQYQKVLDKFKAGAKTVRLLEEREEVIYRGPKVDVVELQDFVMAPMTSMKTEHARLVGKIFTLRGPEIQARAENEDWTGGDEAVERVTSSHDEGRKDQGTTAKDQIEGISRSYVDREKNGEFVLFHGIYRASLGDDGKERRYLVTFHYLSGALLDITHYPYIHGSDNFVPVRIKKRPNRFIGRGFCQMLDDMNIEINTQHNQRIDSRTINTVPSFKAKQTERNNFDPSRPDSRFFPGKVFFLTDLNAVEQFDMKQTDTGESMQEESGLMALADRLVGSMAARSGQRQKGDSREPAAQTRMFIGMSDARFDDYFEQVAGNGDDHEGLNEVGQQVFAILHQFMADDGEIIPLSKAAPQTDPAPAPAPQLPGPIGGPAAAAPGAAPGGPALPAPNVAQPGAAPLAPGAPAPAAPAPKSSKITPQDLDAAQGKVKVVLAKTSTTLNPDNFLTRFMQLYSLLVMDPLVGGNPKGRLALDRTLLDAARIPNPEQYLPPDPQTAQEWMQMQQSIIAAAAARKGGRPGARTRGAGKQPSAGGAAAGQKG